MANNCCYSMKIVGTKGNCERFVRKLKSYEEPNHFWRIFEAGVYNCDGDDDNYEMYICGDCAWSLETCCRASGYSHGIDLFEVNTRELELKLEAWSEESGIGFQEHYIYDNGECLADECEEKFDSNDEVVVGGFGDEYEEWHI